MPESLTAISVTMLDRRLFSLFVYDDISFITFFSKAVHLAILGKGNCPVPYQGLISKINLAI